jgi:enediyne biosynthesis protein E4
MLECRTTSEQSLQYGGKIISTIALSGGDSRVLQFVSKEEPQVRTRRFLLYLCFPVFLSLAIAGVARAQMGVATGNGVATPAKPLPPGIKPPTVRYEDVAAKAGLAAANVSGANQHKQYIIETTGNGVAIFDYDNDGLPDILFVNGDRLQPEGAAPTPLLYRNLGGLKFEDVTIKAGLTHTGWGQGTCAGDFDNDGHVDIFITQWGQNVLYRNQGNGTFRDETQDRGLSSPHTRWSTGCAFVDFNKDGFLDLVVAHYIEFDPAHTPHPGEKSQCQWKGLPVICGPRGLPGETISLYQNDGHGHFADVSDLMHITTPKDYYCFTPLVTDFDNDGWPDIYVACDSTASLYFHNLGGSKGFEEMGVLAGVAYNQEGREQAGMGVATADFRHVGRFDIFKTNFTGDTHTFYQNEGENNFSDDTIAAGLAVNTTYLGWGTAALDIDNDGWKDLILANGHVYPEVDTGHTGEQFKQGRLLYWNRGDGQFFDMSPLAGSGIAAAHSSRGLAVGDLDNDGNDEIVIVNMGEPPSLLKNMAPQTGHSIAIRVLTSTNRDAIGARVTVTTAGQKQMDEVRSGGSYISQNDLRLLFGLGKAVSADLSIRWPDGKVENFPRVAAGQILTVQENKGIIGKQSFASVKR